MAKYCTEDITNPIFNAYQFDFLWQEYLSLLSSPFGPQFTLIDDILEWMLDVQDDVLPSVFDLISQENLLSQSSPDEQYALALTALASTQSRLELG